MILSSIIFSLLLFYFRESLSFQPACTLVKWANSRHCTTSQKSSRCSFKSNIFFRNHFSLHEKNSAISDGDGIVDIDPDSDEYFRAKLKAEIASPFYRLRQFLYVSMVGGGGLGVFTTIPQAILAAKNGGDIQTVGTNLAIDLGAAVLGTGLWYFDGKQQQKKIDRFTKKELRLSNKISPVEADDRADRLKSLPVEIQISEFNETTTRIVPLGDILLKGKQNAIIFAGKKSIVKDACLSARIEGSNLFTKEETFVVPVVVEDDKEQIDATPTKGFATKDGMLSAPYFGKPTQVNVWKIFLEKEIDLAKKQGEKDILSKGLVLVVRKDGKVIRRGVGLPPWRTVVEEFKTKKS